LTHLLKNTVDNQPAEVRPVRKKRKIVDGGLMVLMLMTFGAAIGVAAQKGMARVFDILGETLMFALTLSPKILGGVFIAAAIPLLVSNDKIAAMVGGERGIWGLGLASILGALMPGGPMMVYPLAAGFVVAGVDIGALVAFVTGWSLLNLNRTLIWEMSFLHADFVLLRLSISIVLPVLCGLAARKLFAEVRA
jgi:uncharacterized membrane protein YraQ (UPF0718 family)